MAYATPDDVEKRLGRELTDGEVSQVEVLLDDIELILKTRIPDLESRVTSGEIDQALVVMVEANAVVRVLKNPEGYQSETDGNYSYQLNTTVASGLLEVLDFEWAWLGIRRGAFTIRPNVEMPKYGPCFDVHWRGFR